MVSGLDINTERGQESLRQEREAIEFWESQNPEWMYLPTRKTSACSADGLLVCGGEIAGVAETKCRDVDERTFFKEFKGEWLVTFSKLLNCKQLADAFHVPLVGFLYLVPARVLLVRKLAENGEFVATMRLEKTTTQATINGGLACRCNAFVDMTTSKVRRYTIPIDPMLDVLESAR